jgi:hypothetical protein
LCGTQSTRCKRRTSTARLPTSGEFWRSIEFPTWPLPAGIPIVATESIG